MDYLETRRKIIQMNDEVAVKSDMKYISVGKRLDRLLMLGDLIDIMYNQTKGAKRGVMLDPKSSKGRVYIDVRYIRMLDGDTHPFFQYGQLADKVLIRQIQKGFVRFEFIIEGLYDE